MKMDNGRYTGCYRIIDNAEEIDYDISYQSPMSPSADCNGPVEARRGMPRAAFTKKLARKGGAA